MQLVTFDHNCLIDLEENRTAAHYLRRLITADQAGQIKVRVVAIGASEQLAGGARKSNFGEFKHKLVKLGLKQAEILKPLLYYGLGFWDWGIWGGDPVSSALEKDLHAVLFPGIEFTYEDYCSGRHIDIHHAEGKLDRRWVNERCDVLGLLLSRPSASAWRTTSSKKRRATSCFSNRWRFLLNVA
jgi:hypothetical protein